MQLPPVLCSLSCYWCHPLIIFHSCFQYPALYESWFSSFMYQHSCALCMCKYKQCKYIWWLWQCLCVCPLYKYTHKFECIWAPGFLCGCLKKKNIFIVLYNYVCSCLYHPFWLSFFCCLSDHWGCLLWLHWFSTAACSNERWKMNSMVWVWGNWSAPSFPWLSEATGWGRWKKYRQCETEFPVALCQELKLFVVFPGYYLSQHAKLHGRYGLVTISKYTRRSERR